MAELTPSSEIRWHKPGVSLIFGYQLGRVEKIDTSASSPTVEPGSVDPLIMQTTFPATASATNTTVISNPWPQLIGRYKQDKSWDEFGSFLQKYRKKTDRIYSQSETSKE